MIQSKSKKKVLICQDYEPDDLFSMLIAEAKYEKDVEFFILVVSPNPKYHTECTKKLFDAMKQPERLLLEKEQDVTLKQTKKPMKSVQI